MTPLTIIFGLPLWWPLIEVFDLGWGYGWSYFDPTTSAYFLDQASPAHYQCLWWVGDVQGCWQSQWETGWWGGSPPRGDVACYQHQYLLPLLACRGDSWLAGMWVVMEWCTMASSSCAEIQTCCKHILGEYLHWMSNRLTVTQQNVCSGYGRRPSRLGIRKTPQLTTYLPPTSHLNSTHQTQPQLQHFPHAPNPLSTQQTQPPDPVSLPAHPQPWQCQLLLHVHI